MAVPAFAILDGDQVDAIGPSDGARERPATPVTSDLKPSVHDAACLPAKLQWSLVTWYRSNGDFADAEALLDQIAARGGETGRLLEERARLAAAMGRMDEAAALMEERVQRAPSATAQVALARIYLEADNVPAAEAISADLCRSHPDLTTVAALAADIARAMGDLAAARGHHEAVLQERPDSSGALLALARIALVDGDRRQASTLLDRALAAAGEAATPGLLSTAAAIAELIDQPIRAGVLRARAARLDSERTAALLDAVAAELGPRALAAGPRAASSPGRTRPLRQRLHPISPPRRRTWPPSLRPALCPPRPTRSWSRGC